MSERISMTAGLLKHTQPEFHYLMTNVFEWITTTDLHDGMKQMDKKGYTYWVWYVPGESTHYEINFYQPQVQGSFVLAEVEKKAKAKR